MLKLFNSAFRSSASKIIEASVSYMPVKMLLKSLIILTLLVKIVINVIKFVRLLSVLVIPGSFAPRYKHLRSNSLRPVGNQVEPV